MDRGIIRVMSQMKDAADLKNKRIRKDLTGNEESGNDETGNDTALTGSDLNENGSLSDSPLDTILGIPLHMQR